MIEFRRLPDDHPDFAHSPLLRAALLTLQYAAEHGPIGLTTTKAFKRTFVAWAAEHFDWPGMSHGELTRFRKVLNEYDFLPLEILHGLLIELKFGRHSKAEFRLTRRGAEFAQRPAQLFAELIPFYVLRVDHSRYARVEERPLGNWDVWLNVMNVEIDKVATEKRIFGVFYGEGPDWDNAGWREMAVFSSYVLRPLEWAGLVAAAEVRRDGHLERHYSKTPLWRSALKLDTDDMLAKVVLH